MRFIDVSEHTLADARPGVELMEQLLKDTDVTPYLYGLTSHAEVLLAAQESLEGEYDTAPTLAEVAIAIPFGGDVLYYLSGSGLSLRNEDFAYIAGEDGVRVHSFRSSHSPKVVSNDFTKMAVADSDSWLDDFFQQYATAAVAKSKTVTREPIPATASKRYVNPIDLFLG